VRGAPRPRKAKVEGAQKPSKANESQEKPRVRDFSVPPRLGGPEMLADVDECLRLLTLQGEGEGWL
jgi:hypothetical protein